LSSCSATSVRWARWPRRCRPGRGGVVEIRAAERGDKRRILELAERNARLAIDQEKLRSERRRQQRVEALDGLQQRSASTWCRCGSSASTSRR